MLRGWESKHNPSNDVADSHSPTPPAKGQRDTKDQYTTEGRNKDSNEHSTQEISVEDAYPDEDKSLFRGWKGNNGYEEVRDEILMNRREVIVTDMIDDDPLASPGNSSLNSGTFGGWSLTEGLKEKESLDIPYEDDDEVYNNNENNGNRKSNVHQSSSPRGGRFKTYGLSMVREDEHEGGIPNSPNDTSMLDDVDIEASTPSTMPTSSNIGELNKQKLHARLFDKMRKNGITNRVLQELQTNPKLKYQTIVALSFMLALSCLIGVVVMSSSGEKKQTLPEYKEANKASELVDLLNDASIYDASSTPTTTKLIVTPTVKTTTTPMIDPTGLPTFNPTMEPTTSLTSSTAIDNTSIPSSKLGTTLLPSHSPITMTPTRDCSDSSGEFQTWDGKLRTCEWLDNGHNGEKSSRKDLDCRISELGDACHYTCRLYNGCMEYLLSALSDYTNENDISVGDHCTDKVGFFISKGNTPRECSWLNEDEETAPAKKNTNCGTPDIPKTELGLMCPGSCAGYNDCKKELDGTVERVAPNPDHESDKIVDDEDDITPTSLPTFYPTLLSSSKQAAHCQNKEGEFLTHKDLYRKCHWLNHDDILSAEEKKQVNCGITEIGLNCLESCPCNESNEALDIVPKDDAGTDDDLKEELDGLVEDECQDKDGEFLTHRGTYRQCRWLNQDDLDSADEKKDFNCGITEIGLSCLESCPCDVLDNEVDEVSIDDDVGVGIPTFLPTLQPTSFAPIVDDTSDELTEELLNQVLEGGPPEDPPEDRLGKALLGGFPTVYPTVELALSPPASIILTASPSTTTSPTMIIDCIDKKGKFKTPSGASQYCTWLSEGKGDLKKELNCQEPNEALYFCQASCSAYNGCDSMHCTDMPGLYATFSGWLAECSFLTTTGQGSLRLEQNCGGVAGYPITEIGKRCQATCSDYNGCNKIDLRNDKFDHVPTDDVPTADDFYEFDGEPDDYDDDSVQIDDGSFLEDIEQLPIRGEASEIFFGGIPTYHPTTLAPATSDPTAHPMFKGFFDDTRRILSLSVFADASISQMNADGNYGEDKRLHVQNDVYDEGTNERQSLLLFDLSFVIESFGSTIGRAILRIYLIDCTDSGSVTLKKMISTNWTEDTVTWDNVPGGDGVDELTISFVDTLVGTSWYDIDVTAAVLDALEIGESYLGIRIVSDEAVDVTFASKERLEDQPMLIIDSRPAFDPTLTRKPKEYSTTDFPTPSPTSSSPVVITPSPTSSLSPTSSSPTLIPTTSPMLPLDCMDKKGKFKLHSGEFEPCTWLDVGNGKQKKELNCLTGTADPNEAALFCQASCSAYNGCNEMRCVDNVGAYMTHTGFTAKCSWLLTGLGSLKLEQNCGSTPEFPRTEIGQRCQATCKDYNGCNTAAGIISSMGNT